MARQRRATLPEVMLEAGRFRDTGCSVAPACLACPLPVCRYDVNGGARAIRNIERNAEIKAAVEAGGESVAQIASRLGVATRTVWRVLNG